MSADTRARNRQYCRVYQIARERSRARYPRLAAQWSAMTDPERQAASVASVAAFEQLLEANAGLRTTTARRWAGVISDDFTADDIDAACLEHMWHSAELYDTEGEYEFTTYVGRAMNMGVARHRAQMRGISVPVNVRHDSQAIQRAEAQCAASGEAEPTDEALALALGWVHKRSGRVDVARVTVARYLPLAISADEEDEAGETRIEHMADASGSAEDAAIVAGQQEVSDAIDSRLAAHGLTVANAPLFALVALQDMARAS